MSGSARAIVGGLTVAAGSLALLRTDVGRRVDAVASRVVARDLGGRADEAVGIATDLGSVYAIAGAVGVLLAAGDRDLAVEVAASGLVAWGAGQAAKGPIRRPRPYQADGARRLVHEPAGTSWPSGHSAVAGAIAAAAWPRAPRRRRPLLAALPAFVAASRVYVGVHYFTDVLAGVGLGVASGAVAVRALRTITAAVRRA